MSSSVKWEEEYWSLVLPSKKQTPRLNEMCKRFIGENVCEEKLRGSQRRTTGEAGGEEEGAGRTVGQEESQIAVQF